MKKIILVIIVVAVAAGLIWGLLKMRGEKNGEKEHDKPPEAAAKVEHSTNGETTITLDAETQKRIGLQVATATATNLNREIKGYGRVLDPAPLAALTADLVSANFAAAASIPEFERLKTLNEQNNASTRALQMAEANARRDQMLVQSTRDKIISSWGKAVARQNDLPAFVRSLTSLESVILRIDLPAGETLNAPPNGARLVSLLTEDKSADADFLGPAPVVDAQTQGQGFLFLVKMNSLGLTPGAALTAFLKISSEPLAGVLVPRSAVVRYDDKSWVYVQTTSAKYVRHEISIVQSTEQGWFVSSGLTANNQLVVAGAQMLLSEELKSQGNLAE